MAEECNDTTCVWVCNEPGGCTSEGAGWVIQTFGCTGDPTCGCVVPSLGGAHLDELETSCVLGGTTTTAPPCDGNCPPDDWRNTADLDPWDEPTTTSTTTTTTSPPCTGECTWVFDVDTEAFSLVKSSCSTGCDCYYPNFCPPAGCEVVITDCVTGAPSDHGTPPNCAGTTTTTTTAPGCVGSCSWKYYPVIGWVLTSPSPCDSTCPCATPTGAFDYCDETTTPCVGTTHPPCGGSCTYRYGDADSGWILESRNCTSSDDCSCVPPSVPGSVCNQATVVPCNGTYRDPGPPPPPPPGVCTGVCYYCWSGSEWIFSETNCVGCLCGQPPYAGTNAGEVGIVPCLTGTTTTTTTTTTAAPCTVPCGWRCDYPQCWYLPIGDAEEITPWTLILDAGCSSETCGCAEPTVLGVEGETVVWYCVTGGTTLAPTTTTTSPPCSESCAWSCPEGFFCDGTVDAPWTLDTNNCTGASTCGCPMPVLLSSGSILWPCSNACTGTCRYRCDVPAGCGPSEWTFVGDTCSERADASCVCTGPGTSGALDDVIDIDCSGTTTTTSTTTTAPPTTTSTTTTTTTSTTTTTTAAPTCGTCNYTCADLGGGFTEWQLTANNCSGGCACDPPVGSCLVGANTTTNCVAPP